MKSASISSKHFHTFYIRYLKSMKRPDRKILKDTREVLRLQSLIWQTVAEHYLENQGGVYIDNIGYLCHMIRPERELSISYMMKELKYISSNGYRYRHLILDLVDKRRYYHFELSDSLIRQSKVLVSKGRRYRFLYNEVIAKKRIIKDKKVKIVYDKDKLKCKLINFL